MSEQDTMIAVCMLHDDAEEAFKTLQRLGLGPDSVSVVGRNFHTVDTVVGYSTAGDGVRPCGRLGPFWGSFLTSFSEFGLFWVPDLGPVVMAGELMSRVRQASDENVIVYGLTALGIDLYSMGVPEYGALGCEDAIRQDKFILVVRGCARDLERARGALAVADVESIEIHHSSMQTAV